MGAPLKPREIFGALKIRKDCDVAKGGVIFFYLSLSLE
ncbi:unnamed protein product [Brassica rapa subsp. narinosa]